eukprot:gene17536-17812_t
MRSDRTTATASRETAKREFDDPVFRLVVTVFNMVQCHREAFNEFVRRRYGERVRFRWLGTDRVTFSLHTPTLRSAGTGAA